MYNKLTNYTRTAVLASLIASAFSANAYTISGDAGEATVYGKVGVGYDSFKVQQERRTDEITVSRNSEIGLKGQIANNSPFDILFDINSRYKSTGGFELDRLSVTFETDIADVLVGRSDSSYDIVTREFDKFNDHFTEDFEVGDKVRDHEMLSVSRMFDSGLYLSADIAAGNSRANVGDMVSVAGRYPIGYGLVVAAAYENDETLNASNVLNVTEQYKAGINYSYHNRLDLGLIVNYKEMDTRDTEVLTTSLSGAYSFSDDWVFTLGVALIDEDSTADSYETVVTRMAADYHYTEDMRVYLGFAHNDRSDLDGGKNDFMHTLGLIYNF